MHVKSLMHANGTQAKAVKDMPILVQMIAQEQAHIMWDTCLQANNVVPRVVNTNTIKIELLFSMCINYQAPSCPL